MAYVINRNVNFTNVCVKRCGFCAFSRGHRAEQGYFLPTEEILRRVREAWDLGATEVCIQAGLPPRIDGSFYIDLCSGHQAKEIPEIHVHAFSPEEILYGATLSNRSIEDYLMALKDVGLGSMPGTSAEILDDRVREIISPGRISTRDWKTVIRTAHKVGIPTTSTIMYGHMESALDRARHLELLRGIQKETGGITEFVPLSFIAAEAPMVKKSLVAGVRTERYSRRCFAHVRGGAADAGPMDAEYSSHVGEAGSAAGAGVPPSRRERFWRNADERKHFDVGRRAAWPIPAPGGDAILDSRGGTGSGPAIDNLPDSASV